MPLLRVIAVVSIVLSGACDGMPVSPEGAGHQVLRMFSKQSHRSMSLVSSGNCHENAAGERIIERDDLRITCR